MKSMVSQVVKFLPRILSSSSFIFAYFLNFIQKKFWEKFKNMSTSGMKTFGPFDSLCIIQTNPNLSIVNSAKDQTGIIENEDFKNIMMMMKHALANEDYSAIPDYTYFLLTLFNGDRKG